MKKVVIIGANDFQNPLILKAKEKGYETHVFAWQDGSIGEKTADYFYPISIVEKQKILEKCKEIKPDAIVTIASDLANITVNYVANHLGMKSNSEETLIISTNKYKMRDALKKAGLPCPEFRKVNEKSDIESLKNMKLPLIVKPTDRSGSRGIMKVTDYSQIEAAIKEAIELSFEKEAIIEEFLEGEEYSCECISYEGKHHFLALTKKFTTGSPHFIETGHMEPAEVSDETYDKIKQYILKALDALKIEYGASHAECKIDNKGNIGIIEIGSRMGGDCIGSHLVYISTGYDFVEMVLDVAMGEAPKMIKTRAPKKAVIKFIFGKDDINDLNKIQSENPEWIEFVSEIDNECCTEIVDSASRYGYYILAV